LLPLREEVHIGGATPPQESFRRVYSALREAAHAPPPCGARSAVDLHDHPIVASHACGPAICDNTHRTALELQKRVRGILHIDRIGLPALVTTLRYGGRHQGAHPDHRRGKPINHVAPVRHHIERDAAAFGTLVVPAWPLAFLGLAVEDPRSRIDPDPEDAPEKAGIL